MDPFGIGSDEEDNLFASAPTISKPPASTQPVKTEEVHYYPCTCITVPYSEYVSLAGKDLAHL